VNGKNWQFYRNLLLPPSYLGQNPNLFTRTKTHIASNAKVFLPTKKSLQTRAGRLTLRTITHIITIITIITIIIIIITKNKKKIKGWNLKQQYHRHPSGRQPHGWLCSPWSSYHWASRAGG